jgi:hypothetical protein
VLERKAPNEVDFYHLLTYDIERQQVLTDRSTEQLATAATYFSQIATQIIQRQRAPKQVERLPERAGEEPRPQGLEL